MFSDSPKNIGKTHFLKLEINLTDNAPFKKPYRRILPGMYEDVRQHVKEMLDVGAIQPSHSPYLSTKKDETLRLNSRTVKDVYNHPRIGDTIDRLVESKFFAKPDLTSSYWQVEVDEKKIERKQLFQSVG